MDLSALAQATGASISNAQKYLDHLNEGFKRFDISTHRQKAMFLAQVSVESQRLQKVEEDLYYKDAARMASIYPSIFKNAAAAEPYTKSPNKFSQLRYQGYHGRGLIQLTWRKAYEAYSRYSGVDYVLEPKLLLRPHDATMSACWFFTIYSGDCRPASDEADVAMVTRLVNGPKLMHLAERRSQFSVAIGCDL